MLFILSDKRTFQWRAFKASSERGSILFALLYSLALAGYPLVASISTLTGLPNRLMSISYKLGFLSICGIVFFQLASNRLKMCRSWIWFPIIGFWVLYTLRMIFDTYLNPISLSQEPYEYWLWAFGGSLVPMFAFMGRFGREASLTALKYSFVVAGGASVLVLAAFSGEMFHGITTSVDVGRLSLSVLNPISVGNLGGTVIILSVSIWLHKPKQNNHWFWMASCLFSISLGLGLLLAASSRGPLLATFFALGVLTISKMRLRQAFWFSLFIPLLLVVLVNIATVIEEETSFNPIQRVMGPSEYSLDESVSIRLQAYAGAWDQFLESPIIGSALEERTTGFYPHNLILEAFMATGIFGGIAFFSLLAVAFFGAWKLIKSGGPFLWIGLLFLQYLIGSMFSGSLWGSSTMWVLMAGVFAASHSSKDLRKNA